MTEAATSSASEWYIITDDAALTLRITPGLTLGEEAHGELALSRESNAAQWVRFDPAVDGTLTLTRIDDRASLSLDGATVDSGVEVTAGTLIQLPNNRLLISNHFRGQAPAGAVLRIGHSSAYQGPPLLTTGVSRAVPTPSGRALAARPPQGPGRAPVRSRTAGNSAAAASQHGGQPLEEALSRRREAVGSLLHPKPSNPTEEALVPVAAEAPFDEEDLKTFLEQPIDLRETGTRTIPILTTTTVPRTPTAVIPGQPTKRNLLYIGTLGGIVLFGLISALLAALLNQPASRVDDDLPPLAGESLTLLPQPEDAPPVQQVQRPTDALLRSVDNVIAEGDSTDASVWDFAIRTYEFVLAQEPDNAAARLRLQEARQTLAALEAGTAAPAPEAPATGSDGSIVAAIAQAADTAAVTPPPALTKAQSALLDLAEERLEFGQVISPSGAAAVPLILSVLRDTPTAPRAINLLNRSAELLLREAEAAWATNNQYLARNILEEVFAFHPRHADSNQRWTEWTGLPPRVPPATSPAAID